MPGENLSRDEAQERAALLSVDGYEVSLDLRSAVGDAGGAAGEPRTFRSVTTIRFQPTIVPRPRAKATAILTQVGMKRVPASSEVLKPVIALT